MTYSPLPSQSDRVPSMAQHAPLHDIWHFCGMPTNELHSLKRGHALDWYGQRKMTSQRYRNVACTVKIGRVKFGYAEPEGLLWMVEYRRWGSIG